MFKPIPALVAALALVVSISAPSFAADADDVVLRVILQAQSSVEVENDTMRALMSTEAEDANPAKVADQVNRVLGDAARIAKAQPGVKVRTGSYQTFPIYDKTNRIARWRARGELSLESQDFKGLTALLGRLQATLGLNGVEFLVSEEARRKADDDLTATAIGEFRRRADIAAKAAGGRTWQLREMVVNPDGGSGPSPRPAMLMRGASADMAAPPMEGGSTRIGVVVTGTIVLEGK
jgi:predicted secreted protein